MLGTQQDSSGYATVILGGGAYVEGPALATGWTVGR